MSAKVAQINAIRVAGNSASVSYYFYAINLMTGGARIYTNIIMVGGQILSFVSSKYFIIIILVSETLTWTR